MEWMFFRDNQASSIKIIDFLIAYNFVPTWGLDHDRIMDPSASHSWPDNVFWMKL